MAGTTSQLRVALIGAGAMGSYHARVIAAHSAVELACVVDPSEQAGRSLADRYETQWAPEVADLGAFDAVVLACPTSHHVQYALQAIEAETPVLVEKPISECPDEVALVIDRAARRGVPLTCGFPERFNPAIVTMRQMVEAPIHVNAIRHSPFLERVATGVCFDLVIHDVDVVLRMAGSAPTEIRASVASAHPKSATECEDLAEVSLLFGDGLVAGLSASRVSQRKVRTLMVSEVERLIEVDLVRQDITVYRHLDADFLEGGRSGLRQHTVIDIVTIEHGKEALAGQLDHFVDLTRGESDAAAELATLFEPHRVVAAALESAGH